MRYSQPGKRKRPSAAAHWQARPGSRLAFLRYNLLLVLLWPLIALLIAIVGWRSLNSELEQERKATEQRALSAAATLARGYAGQVVRTVDVVDQILLHVRFEWKLSKGALRLEDNRQGDLFPSSPLFNVGIVGRDGRLLTNTVPSPHNTFAWDRQYFMAQQEAVEDTLYIGEATVGRVSNRTVVHFSRRIADDEGSFNGVVRASVAPSYLTATYDAVTLGEQGLMAIVGKDLAMRAARIGETISGAHDVAIRSTVLLSAPARESLFARAGGSMLARGDEWFVDGRSRYLGWQQLEGHPLIALVGIDQEHVLAPYLAARASAIEQATISSAVLLAFTIAAMWLSMENAQRKHRMEITQAAYRLASEEGTEGIYICRPVSGRNGTIEDFEFIDCNQAGARFYGRTREQVLGKRLSQLHQSGEWRQRIMRLFLTATQHGSLEEDVEVRSDGNRSRRWFRVKIARSDEILSVITQDITKSKEHILELERRGNEDALTGLPNRYWMTGFLPGALQRAADEASMLALLFIDLDGFKAVNDTAGHDAGNELLRNVALRIKQAVRPSDHVVRVGGDEFVVIVEQLAAREALAQMAERVLHAFDENFSLSGGTFRIGTSIGISIFPDDGKDGDTLLSYADAAMYAVKSTGKHGYRFFSPQHFAKVRNRQVREAELRHALELDQFILYFQPRVDVATGNTCSMEALVRWAHPLRGIVEPNEFIPLAEETGLIVRLGELVIQKVCAQLAFWRQTGRKLVPVSINVSARQFTDRPVAKILREALTRHGIPPALVEIELTESSMLGDSQQVAQSLEELQRLGVALAVDDFGTGYSSLSQLQRLDFDVLKVDRAFTTDLAKTRQGEVFFTAIITMAHALGMRVVAEGVETLEQAKKLKALRCDEIQGFFVSRPLPASPTQPVLPKQRFH